MKVAPQPLVAAAEASWWPRAPVRRRRAAATTFLLCIADHDTGRFTIEGPMSDAEPWIREIIGARRAGREITCHVLSGTPGEAMEGWLGSHGGTPWPPGSIISPETPR
jgi:hypothetical protein